MGHIVRIDGRKPVVVSVAVGPIFHGFIGEERVVVDIGLAPVIIIDHGYQIAASGIDKRMGQLDIDLPDTFGEIEFSVKNKGQLRGRDRSSIKSIQVGLGHPDFNFPLRNAVGKIGVVGQPFNNSTRIEFIVVIEAFTQASASPITKIDRVVVIIICLIGDGESPDIPENFRSTDDFGFQKIADVIGLIFVFCINDFLIQVINSGLRDGNGHRKGDGFARIDGIAGNRPKHGFDAVDKCTDIHGIVCGVDGQTAVIANFRVEIDRCVLINDRDARERERHQIALVSIDNGSQNIIQHTRPAPERIKLESNVEPVAVDQAKLAHVISLLLVSGWRIGDLIDGGKIRDISPGCRKTDSPGLSRLISNTLDPETEYISVLVNHLRRDQPVIITNLTRRPGINIQGGAGDPGVRGCLPGGYKTGVSQPAFPVVVVVDHFPTQRREEFSFISLPEYS